MREPTGRVPAVIAASNAAREVVSEAVDFLNRRTSLIVSDAKTDLSCLVEEFGGADGASGSVLQVAGVATGASGLAVTAFGALGLLAVANVWNPFDWAAGGATAIGFVGGIRGTKELVKLVDSGKYAVAFSLHPVNIKQLISVADSGQVMPPKSTWFEPKLRSGLFVHQY